MKTRTRSIFRLLFLTTLISSSLLVQAQSPRIKATYYGSTSIVNKGDTIQLLLTGYRGQLQWQTSLDTKDWADIAGQTTEALRYRIDTNLFFRARMKEENCDAVFSDTASFVPVLLAENAVVIDPQKVMLKSDSLDLAKGVYRYDFTADPGIKSGDVIVGKEWEGYIRVVSGVETNGNEITLTTMQGTVENVIKEILIHDSLVISMNGPDPKFARVNGVDVPFRIIHQEPGVTLKSGGGIILDNTVLVNKKVGNAEVSAKINSGKIDFNPIFHRDLHISLWNGLEDFSMSAGGQIQYSCGLEVKCSYQFNYTPDPLTLLEVEIGPIMIGVVPMFIELSFDVGCELNFGAYGLFEMGYESDYSVEFGAKYDKFASPEKWSPIWLVNKGFIETPPNIDIGADLTAKLYIRPRIATKIAAIAGPYLEVEPYLRRDAHINLPNWNYGLFGGIDSRLGFEVSILGYNLANFFKILKNWEWPIITGSGTNPTVTTNDVQNVTKSSASVGGSITSAGGTPIIEKGICWSLSPKPNLLNHVVKLGSGTAAFSTILQGLAENSKYYFNAYAINASGIGWGEEKSFTANIQVVLPTVTTTSISAITQTTATGGGNVKSDGWASVTARGVCWSTSQNPTTSDTKTTNGTGTGSFTSNLTGLSANTPYYVRAYATNSAGPGYGDQVSFTTSGGGGDGTFTDSRDGHSYPYKTIGTQTWMTENLAWLPSVNPFSVYSYDTPFYYVYGYEGSTVASAKATGNYTTYGVLYNWPAALTACPSGWHLPTDEEWKVLEKNQGMSQSDADAAGWRYSGTIGGKLKEAGTSHWISPNTGATNSSGFTALPGGLSTSEGFTYLGSYTTFWSASESDASLAWGRTLYCYRDGVYRYYGYCYYGFSVRCLQN